MWRERREVEGVVDVFFSCWFTVYGFVGAVISERAY